MYFLDLQHTEGQLQMEEFPVSIHGMHHGASWGRMSKLGVSYDENAIVAKLTWDVGIYQL